VSRILLTGATGFIGRHVLTRLTGGGHEVDAVTTKERPPADDGVTWHRADLLSSAEIVADVQPEVLLHLAWYVEPGRYWTGPENIRWVEASLALLRAFAGAGGRRAVVAGTSAEYDWHAAGPRCHEQRTPLAPATLYGAAKHALHTAAAPYAEQAGFELAWGRIFFVYGPGEPDGRLVPLVGRSLLDGRPVPTTGGDQVRDFMYVEDAAAAIAALAESEFTGAVNIASGDPVRVRDVVDILAQQTGRPDLLRPGTLPDREGDPPRLVADITRLREDVGFTPQIAVHEGLAETLKWLRSSEPKVRQGTLS
jgi:nucleoside-diphosphate-sugar epimerase